MIGFRQMITLWLTTATLTVSAQHVMDVNTRKWGTPIQKTMYGIFFEDINYAADGGLYGELIKNRSFEFQQPLMGWTPFGRIEVKTDGPFERCPHYVVLSDPGHKDRRTGLMNEGYFGIGVEQDADYRFTVWAKAPEGNSQIRVQLVNISTMEEEQQFTEQRLDITSPEWRKYELIIRSPRTEPKAQLRIFLSSPHAVCLEHISLFPVDTYKHRENGLRRDLAQALEGLHPGVFRFPGGCIVEGTTLDTRYQWKNTVGPVENRPTNRNRWEDTFDKRYFADYHQSYGLGFFEFFQLAEDIGAEPLPVLSVGLSCQFQNSDESAYASLDQLQPFIDDCLDLIEFANGPVDSQWGKVRASMGHPTPFHLKYIAVGNEQWDAPYFQRLEPFVKAIRARYPDIRIIGSSGPFSEGDLFDRGWAAMRQLGADLVDEHFYCNEDWFLSQGLRYEHYPRKGPKVFAGEYACHGKNNKKWNHYYTSLMEAAFMTDLERNADIVHMATYAPLFAHVEGWQWRPDMIWFDNLRMFRTVSYYVQQLYATHRGTHVLPLTMNKQFVAGQQGQDGLFASAVYNETTGEVYVKIANTSNEPQPVVLNLLGMKGAVTATMLTLHHNGSPDDENTLDHPTLITPQEGNVKCENTKKHAVLRDVLPALSFRVYQIRN